MRYWDSSALGSLLLDEVHSSYARPLFDQDPEIVVWWGSSIECMSVIWGASRRGRLSADIAYRTEEWLFHLQHNWTEIQPSDEVRRAAGRIIRVHDLGASDAFQLAAALAASERNAEALPFVCFDRRLTQAARREGLFVITQPEDHP